MQRCNTMVEKTNSLHFGQYTSCLVACLGLERIFLSRSLLKLKLSIRINSVGLSGTKLVAIASLKLFCPKDSMLLAQMLFKLTEQYCKLQYHYIGENRSRLRNTMDRKIS